MIHSKNNLKTNYTYKLINLLNQPAQFNKQEGSNFGIGMAGTRVCEKTSHEIAPCPSGGEITILPLECELASNS